MTERIQAPGHAGVVEFTLPADQRFVRVARAAAVACATMEEFSVDDVADLRLLVDEAFHALMLIGSGPIMMTLTPLGGAVELGFRTSCSPQAGWDDTELELLHTMLGVMCVHGGMGIDAGTAWFEAEVRPLNR